MRLPLKLRRECDMNNRTTNSDTRRTNVSSRELMDTNGQVDQPNKFAGPTIKSWSRPRSVSPLGRCADDPFSWADNGWMAGHERDAGERVSRTGDNKAVRTRAKMKENDGAKR